jgi:oxygen-independent coproporphyrinogen-3 oxidase
MHISNPATVCDLPAGSESKEPLAGNYFVSAYPPFSAWSSKESPSIVDSLRSLPPDRAVPWGVYIHLPFCDKRCDYCYYLSFGGTPRHVIESYVEQLGQEAKLYSELPRFKGRSPRFVYFGGGTPSLLAAQALQRLLADLDRRLDFQAAEEITFECSPKSLTVEKLTILHAAGVNRISLGVQQLDDTVLKLSGRIHLEAAVCRAAAQIRAFGFAEFNVDLIAGLRGQSDDSFIDGVKRVIELAPDCVTIYQLEVPENTPLFQSLADEQVTGGLADWETKRRRVAAALELLEHHGYTVRNAYSAALGIRHPRFVYTEEQYRGADLVGLGLSSFSFVAGMHFQNMTKLRDYADAIERGEFAIHRGHKLGFEEQMVREFVLQLKLGYVSRTYFRQKFDTDPVERFAFTLSEIAADGYVTWDEQCIRLTRGGLVRVDRLLPAFYLEQHRKSNYW